MPIKVLIQKDDHYVTFYTGETDKEIQKLDDIRHIYDVRIDVPVVFKTYTHETKNYIKICTNDVETEFPGGSVIRIKSGECALYDKPFEPIEDIFLLRSLLIDYFKI